MSVFMFTEEMLKEKINTLRRLDEGFRAQIIEIMNKEEWLYFQWESFENDEFHKRFHQKIYELERFSKEINYFIDDLESMLQRYGDAKKQITLITDKE